MESLITAAEAGDVSALQTAIDTLPVFTARAHLSRRASRLGEVLLSTICTRRACVRSVVPFSSSICKPHLRCFEILLDNGADVNFSNDGKETPLHRAVTTDDHMPYVRLLTLRTPNLDAVKLNGETPLYVACVSNASECVEHLLDLGADMEISATPHLHTPLHTACSDGHLGVVKLLLNGGADTESRDAAGATPLHLACDLKDRRIALLLLSRGADINSIDEEGNTPLMAALANKRLRCFDLLFVRGADLNSQNELGNTVLHLACDGGYDDGLLEFAELVISGDANLNIQNEDGDTPLHLVCSGGFPTFLELLLTSEADPDIINDAGLTPLHELVSSDTIELETQMAMTDRLLNFANPAIQDHAGRTPSQVAARAEVQALFVGLM